MIEKVTMRVLAALALAALIYIGWQHYQADMAELASLRTYKASVENRDKVSESLGQSFARQQASAQSQKDTNDSRRVALQAVTNKVATDDKATADFLAMPIPDRLRQADREARIASGLGSGQRADGDSGPAHAGSR